MNRISDRFTSFAAHLSCALLSMALLLSVPRIATGEPLRASDDPLTRESKPITEVQVDVRFTDGSMLKLAIREDRLDFMTPYGKLYIPVADIKRIEFGLRVPDDVAKRIDSAIADLGNKQYRRRDEAGKILLGLREKAYPAVVNATKHADMEIANRAEELVKKFKESVPAELLQVREHDLIHTENSKIAGRFEAVTLRANTIQFGEVQLRLADVHVLTSKGGETMVDDTNVVSGPVNLVQHQNDIGKIFSFRVTANANGSLWGTDVYTTDSTLAMAVIHCGLLQPGQTGVVKVTIVPSPNVFVGSTRHGVTSTPYQQYPVAYRVHK